MQRPLLVAGIACVGLILFGASGLPAHALSLSPSVIEATANPGEEKTVNVSITNDEAIPVRVYPSLQKFIPLGTAGQQQFLPPSDLEGIPSWTLVGGSDRILQPGERQNVPIRIRVPADAPQGGQYEAVFFSSQPLIPPPESAIGFRTRIGALILFTVGQGEATKLALTEWRLDAPGVQSALAGRAQIRLKNVGQTHTSPQGEVVVRAMGGREVMRLPFNAQQGRILPMSERVFEVPFGVVRDQQGFWSKVRQELISFGMGRYRVSLEGVSGLTATPPVLVLMVLPWRVLLLFMLGLLGLILGLRWYRARLIRALQAKP